MKAESLDELRAAFKEWRKAKRHIREQVPAELWGRVLQATHVYGINAVARATKLEQSRIRTKWKEKSDQEAQWKEESDQEAQVPVFTRLNIEAPPTTTTCPIAEVETATGLKLRIFVQTQETIGLLSSLCGTGGV